MGFFDGFANSAFKKDSEGRDLFFPWGPWSSGFILKSEDQLNELRSFRMKTFMVALPAAIISMEIVDEIWGTVGILSLYFLGYYFWVKKLTQDLARSNVKMKPFESDQIFARKTPLKTLIFFEIAAIGFFSMYVWLLIAGNQTWIPFAGIGLFGLIALSIGYMIAVKLRNRK